MFKSHARVKIVFVGVSLILAAVLGTGSFVVRAIIAEKDKADAITQGTEGYREMTGLKLMRARFIGDRERYYQYYIDKLKAMNIEPAGQAPAEPGTAASIPVLVYHGILDGKKASPNVSVDSFFGQMTALKHAGWRTMSMQEYADFMEGRTALPDRSFLLTFDDGRRDSVVPVDPLLDLLGYHAVMFAISKFVRRASSSYYLSAAELEYMMKSGRWDVEAHGHDAHEPIPVDPIGNTGQYLANRAFLPEGRLETVAEYETRVERDFKTAAAWVEEKTGKKPLAFAFPFGDYGQRGSNYAQAQETLLRIAPPNFPIGFYQANKDDRAPFNEPHQGFLHKRILVEDAWTGGDLAAILEAARYKELPYAAALDHEMNWVISAGERTLRDGSMVLHAGTSTQGMLAVLRGGDVWKDYEFTARVSLLQGESLTLLARYLGEDNHLACTYSTAGVRMRERVRGEEETLLNWSKKLHPLEFENIRVGVYVRDNIVRCIFGDTYLLRTHRSTQRKGTIGFKIWDPVPGNSTLNIQSVEVNPADGG